MYAPAHTHTHTHTHTPFFKQHRTLLLNIVVLYLAMQTIMHHNLIFDRLIEQLGCGQFGTVYRGLWRKETESGGEVDGDETVMEVAVKSLGKEASEKERVMFLKEAAIMGQFNHPYIVKILGIIDEEPVSELFEFISSHFAYKYLSS